MVDGPRLNGPFYSSLGGGRLPFFSFERGTDGAAVTFGAVGHGLHSCFRENMHRQTEMVRVDFAPLGMPLK